MFFVTFYTHATNVILGHILLLCIRIIQIYSWNRKKSMFFVTVLGKRELPSQALTKRVTSTTFFSSSFLFPSSFSDQFSFLFFDNFPLYLTNVLLMLTILRPAAVINRHKCH